MSTKENNMLSLYNELNKFGRNGEYEKALKAANRILGISADEELAIQCKVVCLIQLSKFNDALTTINKTSKLSIDLSFEKAYCLYRLNQISEALKVVENVKNPSLKLKELKAQILYRLEKYNDCFSVYMNIIKNSNDDYEDERDTNLSAVLSNLVAEGSQMSMPQLKEHTYELTYNAACRLVEQGKQLVEAEKKLRAAEKMCKDALEEDGISESEIDNELGIIRVQLAYCLQLQGREKEAQALYLNVLKAKPDDIALIAVASNNLVTLNKDHNVFSSKKRMKSATLDDLEHKLTSRQKKNIAFNQCLLSLITNQGEQFQELFRKLVKSYPDMIPEAILIQAVQLSKEGKSNEAVKILLGNAINENELKIKLACVQLLLNQGERNEAINILENLSDNNKFRLGIVSALVTLYMADNNREKASTILKNAVNYYKNNNNNFDIFGVILRQAADFHFRGGEVEIAAASLEAILEYSPSDKKTLAQLIVAYSQFNPIKAQTLSKQLPPLEQLAETIDIDSLETSNWVIGTKVVKRKIEPSPRNLENSGSLGTDSSIIKSKKKRKRKGKLPKNYNSNVTPDPERWLPKHERTGFRKKRDRRNRDAAMKGTQGAASGTSDMYDITKMPMNVKPSPNPRHSPAVESAGPRQQQRKVQQKKKKKGGKF